jgi:hypothetical protein
MTETDPLKFARHGLLIGGVRCGDDMVENGRFSGFADYNDFLEHR